MSNKEIVLFPNNILRAPAREVIDFKSEEFTETVRRLTEVMSLYAHCVGLAANQIGSDLNVFVADASKNIREKSDYGFVVVANAHIIEKSEFVVKREGCMSVPDLTGDVPRAKSVVVKGFDAQGNESLFKVKDFEARVFQHEIDHLQGKVFLDRVKSARDIFSRKTYRQ